MSDKMIFAPTERPKETCEFCHTLSEECLTFYVGAWDNQKVLGRVCITCLWMGIKRVLSDGGGNMNE